MTLVANNIKYLRRMNGLTQEQFARKIGIKRSLLGAYEEGRANPNLDNLMNIAKIFGTTVDNLLKNDIRRLRESQGVPIPQPAPHLQAKAEPEAPKPLAAIIDKYYRQPVAPTPPPAEPKPAVQPETLTLERGQPTLFRQPVPEPAAPPAPVPAAKQAGSMEWVSQGVAGEYLARYAYPDFLKGLPQMSLPGLPAGKYRAFQTDNDFPVEGATVVAAYVNNWYDIRDGGHYVVVVHKQGILYRRLYNQVKTKGSLLLLSDMPGVSSFEVSIKDVLEIWETKAFVSYQMPEPRPAAPLDGLSVLVQEMQREIERLQK